MAKELYSANREIFRSLIKQARLDAGLTQADLAAKLNRHQSYVSDYERGHRRLDWVAIDEALTVCKSDVARFAKIYLSTVAAMDHR